MQWWAVVIVASAAVPLTVAWRANRGWTIRHALCWSGVAWLGWLAYSMWPNTETAYAALCLTGATGVAVLGARRPGVVAWNFVVASLLIVLWLGWAEGWLGGSGLNLGTFRLVFLATLIAISLANYLPTRSWLAVMIAAIGCGLCFVSLWNEHREHSTISAAIVASACWAAWLMRLLQRTTPSDSQFSRIWRDFRNRYGAVWSERTREQFNAAAKNKLWPVHLGWPGLRGERNADIEAECVMAMQSLIKRFGKSGD